MIGIQILKLSYLHLISDTRLWITFTAYSKGLLGKIQKSEEKGKKD